MTKSYKPSLKVLKGYLRGYHKAKAYTQAQDFYGRYKRAGGKLTYNEIIKRGK